MTRYFKAEFEGGRVEVRSSETRVYVKAAITGYGVSFHQTVRAAVAKGATATAPCVEIDGAEYRRILASQATKRFNNLSTQGKRESLVRVVNRAGWDQAEAGRIIVGLLTHDSRYRNFDPAVRAEWLATNQRKQANAYKRLLAALRAVDAFDANSAAAAAQVAA